MTDDEYGDSIRAQDAAALRKDLAGVIAEGRRLVASVLAMEESSVPLFDTWVDQRFIGSALLYNALFTAFSEGLAPDVEKAIGAIDRAADAKFSVLVYALYRVARAAGLTIKVPSKYDLPTAGETGA